MGMSRQVPVDNTTILTSSYYQFLQTNIEKYFNGQQLETWDILTVNGDGDPLTATLRVNGVDHSVVFTWNSDGTLATYSIAGLGPDTKTMTVTFSYDAYGNAEFTVAIS